MKVNIYHDGKVGRGIKARIIKHAGKRLLIEYQDETLRTEWFNKVSRKNKGAFASRSNLWFFPSRETEKYKKTIKSFITEEYYEHLFKT